MVALAEKDYAAPKSGVGFCEGAIILGGGEDDGSLYGSNRLDL